MLLQSSGCRPLIALGALLALAGCERTPPAERAAVSSAPSLIAAAPPLKGRGESQNASPGSGPFLFRNVTPETGIDFVHRTGTSPEKPFPAANGSGIASLDFDLDGRQDLYFATGNPLPPDKADGTSPNRLYRNLGSLKFGPAGPAGLDVTSYSAGLAAGDYDADGFPDAYVTCFGPNRLFANQGDGTFRETGTCDDPRWGTSAAFFDADGDGLLDLYVCNYAKWSLETNHYCGDPARGVRIYCSPRSVEPDRHVFYRSSGDGGFTEAADAAGLTAVPGRGQGVVAADLDGDRRTDLYVTNDQNPNLLFYAAGDGRFLDATETSGAAYDARGNLQAGMGVDVGDADGDGLPDLFVTNYADESNSLYRQAPRGSFSDVSSTSGLAAPSLPWIGWGTAFADFDFDGRPDLIVTNGHTDDNFAKLGREGDYAQPPLLFRNAGGRFEEVAASAGEYFRERHVGRALVLADLDDDLALDAVIGHQDGPPAVLRNETAAGRAIRFRLVGRRTNRDGYGATLTLAAGATQTIPARSGGSYLSSHDPRVIAAGLAGRVDLTIAWPWGQEDHVTGLEAGSDYLIVEPSSPGSPPRVLRLGPTIPRWETASERSRADIRTDLR